MNGEATHSVTLSGGDDVSDTIGVGLVWLETHPAFANSELVRAKRGLLALSPVAAAPWLSVGAVQNHTGHLTHTGVCENTLLLRKLWPCSSSAESAIQLLIWCF